MAKNTLFIALFLQALALSYGFAPMPRAASSMNTAVFVVEEETITAEPVSLPQFTERGVSVDQDGKSNVWAIEPKMEVSTKSSEEQTSSALIAGGGLAAFAVVAGLVLTNLPDPNQF